MDIKEIIKTKRFKNIVITLIEILVVAGLIFGVLMFFQNKVNKEADRAGKLNGKGIEAEDKESDDKSDDYYIQINKKLSAVIIYRYSNDKKTKSPYKVFRCSIGKDVKNSEYKTGKQYMWLDINGSWHKYNTQIGSSSWIQSVNYKDKYSYRVSKNSYREIGKSQPAGSSILLNAGDASWIYNNCKKETEVNVIKGGRNDVLPLSYEPVKTAYKYCGWDPTDTDSDNPYNKIAKGKVVTGSDTVYVERGHSPDYLGNILALDEKGKNITGKLKYNDIDYNTLGKYKVTYKYKSKDKKIIKIKQKIVIIDTTPPKVTGYKGLYTLQVDSKDKKSIQNKDNIKKIQNMVKLGVSCNEPVLKIDVYTVSEAELELDKKVPVVIKAQDASGNIGSAQVMCEIKLKDTGINKKYKPPKELEKKRKEEKKKKKK